MYVGGGRGEKQDTALLPLYSFAFPGQCERHARSLGVFFSILRLCLPSAFALDVKFKLSLEFR